MLSISEGSTHRRRWGAGTWLCWCHQEQFSQFVLQAASTRRAHVWHESCAVTAQVFALGICSVFSQILDDLSKEESDAIFKAYAGALDEDASQYTKDSDKLTELAQQCSGPEDLEPNSGGNEVRRRGALRCHRPQSPPAASHVLSTHCRAAALAVNAGAACVCLMSLLSVQLTAVACASASTVAPCSAAGQRAPTCHLLLLTPAPCSPPGRACRSRSCWRTCKNGRRVASSSTRASSPSASSACSSSRAPATPRPSRASSPCAASPAQRGFVVRGLVGEAPAHLGLLMHVPVMTSTW